MSERQHVGDYMHGRNCGRFISLHFVAPHPACSNCIGQICFRVSIVLPEVTTSGGNMQVGYALLTRGKPSSPSQEGFSLWDSRRGYLHTFHPHLTKLCLL